MNERVINNPTINKLPVNTLRMKPLVLAVGALSMMVAGCGGSDQDEGASSRVNVSGLGLDGYLARSEVFQDLNDNGTHEAFERLVYTDDDGYYGYNPITDINYCASTTSVALMEKHCLQAESGSYPIVVRGGYDLVTGEPFFGNMRKTVNVVPGRLSSEIDMITPISTVLSYVPAAQQEAIKTKLGITDADLNRDFYNRSATEINQTQDITKDKALMKLTQQLHKTVSAAAQIAEDTYKVADESTLPQDTTPFIYDSIAESLLEDAVVNVAAVIGDTTKVTEMMTRVKTKIETRYTEKSIALPDTSALGAALLDTDSLTNMTKISDVVDAVVDSLPDAVPTIALTKSSAKAIEVTVSKVAKKKPTTEIDSVITTLNDPTERATLLTELDKESTNISTLTDIDISDSAAVGTVTVITYPAVFTDLGNKRLVFSESNASAEEDMSALLYFSAESSSATSGTLTACVRFVDGLNTDDTLKSGGTLGTFSDVGTWTQLNSGYALILDFDVVGAKKQATIQYGGTNDASEHIYRTDIGDELKIWNGTTIPETYSSTLPSSDATCRTELERVDPIIGFTVVEN